MTGMSLDLIKYTNSYDLCWVPLGRLKETHPVSHVVIVHYTKALVPISRFGYQITWTLSKADTSLKQTVALVPSFRESWLYKASLREQSHLRSAFHAPKDPLNNFYCSFSFSSETARLKPNNLERNGRTLSQQELVTTLNELIPWIISFLSNRRQRVKLGEAISAWLPVNAGVPQGTKLGPILFLAMVNNLSISSPVTSMWKYVDDISFSEVLTRNSDSTTQTSPDTTSAWASLNWMKLNAKKCKELRVCYLRETPRLAPLQIDDQALELVSSHKVLGLVIQSNLKWERSYHRSRL